MTQIIQPDANGEFPTPLDGALWMAATYGIPQTPLRGKRPFLSDWPSKSTTDPEQIRQWAAEYPGCNFGSVVNGKHFIFEADSTAVRDRFKAQGHDFTSKLIIESSPGKGHRYYLSSSVIDNIGQNKGQDFSIRANGEQCVSPGSIHPTTQRQYRVAVWGEPLTHPTGQEVFFWFSERTEKSNQSADEEEEPISEGARNSTLTSIAGKARQNLKMDREQLFEYLKSVNDKRCRPPLPDSEVRTIANSIGGYEVKESGALVFGQSSQAPAPDLDEATHAELAAEALAEHDRIKPPHERYAMSQQEYELESQKEYPVFLLPKQPGPEWDDAILYGAAGDVIRKAAQYNESHPAGMLVDFLVSLGSIIGRGPYFNISATKHYTNEFMARVGDSSYSRKGTGRDMIDQLLRLIDPEWFTNRVQSGFGSGEAIIGHIRDDSAEMRPTRAGGFERKIIPGVQDKRLCIREAELASVFILASKHESRADIIMRDGWDGKPLRNLVKGKDTAGFSNSAKCEEPHISISGDTTKAELQQKMPVGAADNGFGNRFLYVYVSRVKLCPQGSPEINWTQEILDFQQVVKFARTVKHVSMTNSARQWWNDNYTRFENHQIDGLAGKMIARAAAHVRRIAMLYALIDLTDVIELEHFQAAERLWRYCEESAMFIFNGVNREQLRILDWLGNRGLATFNEVRDEMYSRNRKVGLIREDLNGLIEAKRVVFKNGKYATVENMGRLLAA